MHYRPMPNKEIDDRKVPWRLAAVQCGKACLTRGRRPTLSVGYACSSRRSLGSFLTGARKGKPFRTVERQSRIVSESLRISKAALRFGTFSMKACLAVVLVLTIHSATTAQTAPDESAARESVAVGFERRGGFVNFVSGSGRCLCIAQANAESKQPLTNGDTIELDDGRAELVLIPGYYLRLSDHTTARLLDLSRDNLKIEITRGSAFVEIPIEDSLQTPSHFQDLKDRFFNIVTVITPAGEYAIFKAGGYRFDVMSDRESRVRVLKGAVAVGGHIVKDGSASVVSGAVSLGSGDKTVDDAFDNWSRERAATLVQANKSLKQSDWYKEMERGHIYLDIREGGPADANAHVVSARNGVASFVESGVAIKSAAGDWHELKPDAQLADGDRVRTSPHARAQIRPYPDFDFYLNGNTEMIYRVHEDESVSVDVTRGSAALFVSETKVKRAERNALSLSANKTEYTISAPGYYRLNVYSNSESELLVYSGSVESRGEIGSGKRIMMRGESRVTSLLDKDSRDSFDFWSDRRNARTLFTPKRWWFAGLWFLNPETSEYTFVPGERVCKSPYGGSYSTSYLQSHTSRPVQSPGQPNRLPVRPIIVP